MKIEAKFTVQSLRTRINAKGREVLFMLIGYINDNEPESSFLFLPDLDFPDDPFGWYTATEIPYIGSLDLRNGHVILVELDYEDQAKAQRLKIVSAQGVALLSAYEGMVPKWLG